MKITSKQEFHIQLEMTEEEARALDALVGYGGDTFVEKFLPVFYEKMGKHYMKPHEKGLAKLFDNIRVNIGSSLKKIDQARDILK